MHSDQNKYEESLKEYEEALAIRRELAKVNPSAYLPKVATTLNNLANLHSDQNKYEEALKEYEEALEIRRELATTNPRVYEISIAQTCYNLSFFYKNSMQNQEQSVSYMIETVSILLPIAEKVPYVKPYLQRAMAVLKYWGLNDEEIEQLIGEVDK